ncbi:hypothetical protein DFH09DRAFT_1073041 [Mycena vulgaris]|nr:hypothetical protein DFH09DRAFT_1073041 [Mycena vulgaris]
MDYFEGTGSFRAVVGCSITVSSTPPADIDGRADVQMCAARAIQGTGVISGHPHIPYLLYRLSVTYTVAGNNNVGSSEWVQRPTLRIAPCFPSLHLHVRMHTRSAEDLRRGELEAVVRPPTEWGQQRHKLPNGLETGENWARINGVANRPLAGIRISKAGLQDLGHCYRSKLWVATSIRLQFGASDGLDCLDVGWYTSAELSQYCLPYDASCRVDLSARCKPKTLSDPDIHIFQEAYEEPFDWSN